METLISSSATWRPGFRPPFRPMIYRPEPTELYDTNQGGDAGASDLFRLGVVPDRDYRLELRVPETTDGRPANVSFFVFRGYMPYFDLGDENEVPGAMIYNFWLVDDKKNGDLSMEFKAPRFHEVDGRNHSVQTARRVRAWRIPF